jgi:hypothetical protein
MATFLSGMTDINSAPQLFTPDYNFLRYTLEKRTQNYEQGLSQVSSAYNFLNSELSSPINTERRNQYLKNAQQQLQSISSSDLSQQQNVAAANDVFAPMVNDKAFLFDATATANNKKQLAEMENWRTSSNIEERKKFNQDIYNWVRRDMDSLRNDKTGDISKYKWEGRKAFGYVDPIELVEKAAKDQGVKFEDDIDGGTYIYTVENGEMHRKKYKAFAKEVLANNSVFQQQNQILGQSRSENLLELVKSKPENIGKSDDQIKYEYGLNHYDQAKTIKKDYLNNLKKENEDKLADLTTARAVAGNLPDGSSQKMLAVQKANALEMEFNNLKSQYEDGYNSFITQFGKDDDPNAISKRLEYGESFKGRGAEQIFTNEFQEDAVNKYANLRSSYGTKKIKENQAYFKANDELNNSIKNLNNFLLQSKGLEIKQEGQDLKERHEDFIENLKTGKLPGADSPTGEGATGNGKNKVSNVSSYGGTSATQISIVNSLDNLKTQLGTSLSASLTSLIGGPGAGQGAIGILPSLGIDVKHIPALRSYFQKALSANATDGHSITYDQNEANALNALNQGLRNYAVQTGNKDLADKVASEWKKSLGTTDWTGMLDLCIPKLKCTEENWRYIKQYEDHKSLMSNTLQLSTLINSSEKAVVSQLAKNIKVNPEISNLLTDDNTKLINQLTVEGWFKSNKKRIEDANGGIPLTDSDIKEISAAFINGKLKASTTTFLFGANMDVLGGDQESATFRKLEYNNKKLSIPSDILRAEPDAYIKLKKEIGTRYPIPGLSSDFLQKGAMASAVFNIRGKDKDETMSDLVSVTQANSEVWEYKDGTDIPTPVAPEDALNIRRILANYKENVADEGVKIYPRSSANNGLAIEVVFDPKEKDDSKYKKRYLFPINVDQGSPEIFKIYNEVNKVDKYSRIKNAETFEPKPIFDYSNMGIKIEMQPAMKGADHGSYIVYAQLADKTTGVYGSDLVKSPYDYQYDFTKESFEEFENRLMSTVINPYIVTRIKSEKDRAGSSNPTIPSYTLPTFNYPLLK